jgi:hypothetical protein
MRRPVALQALALMSLAFASASSPAAMSRSGLLPASDTQTWDELDVSKHWSPSFGTTWISQARASKVAANPEALLSGFDIDFASSDRLLLTASYHLFEFRSADAMLRGRLRQIDAHVLPLRLNVFGLTLEVEVPKLGLRYESTASVLPLGKRRFISLVRKL